MSLTSPFSGPVERVAMSLPAPVLGSGWSAPPAEPVRGGTVLARPSFDELRQAGLLTVEEFAVRKAWLPA